MNWASLEIAADSGSGIAIVPLTKDELASAQQGQDPRLPTKDSAALSRWIQLSRFSAKAGQVAAVPRNVAGGHEVTWLVGRGDRGDSASMRRSIATAMTVLMDAEPWSLLLPRLPADIAGERLFHAAVEGVHGANYRFRITGGEDEGRRRPGPGRLVLAEPLAAAARWLEEAEAGCRGFCLTRDLVNTPASDLGPSELAAAARDLAGRFGMHAETYTADQLLEKGLRMVHAVGRASSRPPTFTLVRMGPADAVPEIALIGKGVVFDSGGLNLKSPSGMLLMRKDMGGAGTVLGVLEVLGRRGCQVPLVALLPAAENAVGPDSFRPGDVLRAFDGTTVEIGNTDAEGRLLLADALGFARSLGARRLIDLATLTGAARVALGPDIPALFGNDEEMVRTLLEESHGRDEPLWRMPLVDAYDRQLDSPFADVNHISSDSRGGALTAALFLRRFAKDTPWTHVDLYAWEDQGRPETPKGANGQAVRSVAAAILRLSASAG